MKYSKIVAGAVQIFLDGQITYQVGREFAAELRSLSKSYDVITININSPGGQVLGEWAIISAILDLQSKGIEINTQIDGVAASAAAVIALAGNRISMRDFATIMIHKAHADGELGDVEQKILDIMDQSTYKIMNNRVDEQQLKQWLNNGDKWFSADEALQLGMIDTIIQSNIALAVENVENLDAVYLQYSKILKHDDEVVVENDEVVVENDEVVVENDDDLEVKIEHLIDYCEYLANELEKSIKYSYFLANEKCSYEDFVNKTKLVDAEKWLKNRIYKKT